MGCCEKPNSPCSIEDALMIKVANVLGISAVRAESGYRKNADLPRIVVEDQGETNIIRMAGFRRAVRRYRLRMYFNSKKAATEAGTAIHTSLPDENVSAAEGYAEVVQVTRNGIRRQEEGLWRAEATVRLAVYE